MKKRKKAKNRAAVLLARKRHASLTPARRSEIARQAANARWGKDVEMRTAVKVGRIMERQFPIDPTNRLSWQPETP